MPGRPEQRQDLGQRHVRGDRDDVGARHHDVADPELVEAQHVLEHQPLARRQVAGFAGLRERLAQVLAQGFAPAVPEPGTEAVEPSLGLAVRAGLRLAVAHAGSRYGSAMPSRASAATSSPSIASASGSVPWS